MPHGLLTPPAWVREFVAREKAKFPPEIFTPQAEERLLCDVTLQHYFEADGYEVRYRPTQDGPDVVTVGLDEYLQLRRDRPDEERQLTIWIP
jgi:hypothetical protein